MMPGINYVYVIYGCSSARTTPEVYHYQELNTGGKILL